jgi:hypothetical protein
MKNLAIAMLAGTMAIGTCAFAAPEVSPEPTVKPQDCSKLRGKEKDECTQATPAGPVDMKSGKQEKGKSEIAKDRDRKKAGNRAISQDNAPSSDVPKQRPPTGNHSQAGAPAAESGKPVKTQ